MYLLFMTENQTLYPGCFEYNCCLIMNELTRIAENAGAIIKPGTHGYIVNRSILEKIEDKKADVKRMEETKKEYKGNAKIVKACNAAIKAYKAEIDELKAINNDPVSVEHTYIQFVLDGNYYYFGFPDNPFYENYFTKTPVIDGKITKDTYGVKDQKEWLFDSLWRINCHKDDIIEAANLIFNMLVNAGYSEKYRDGKKQRVPNRYNDGWHYETIYRPERFESLEWLTEDK